jgi:hypothetical protein
MNTILWVLQVILCIKFISAAYTHGLRQDRPEIQRGIQKMGAPARPLLFLIAGSLSLGSAALVLPGIFGALAGLVPWAAALLAGMMLASIVFHVRCRDKPKAWVSLILLILCALAAYGPLGARPAISTITPAA